MERAEDAMIIRNVVENEEAGVSLYAKYSMLVGGKRNVK
jgi:hypothetical protein